MTSISSLVRAAALALVALGAGALVPSTGSEAQAQSGWSHGGRSVQHHRAAPRHAYRYRHVAPRRVYHRPVVRHYGPRYRPAYYAPRYRPVYAAPVYYGAPPLRDPEALGAHVLRPAACEAAGVLSQLVSIQSIDREGALQGAPFRFIRRRATPRRDGSLPRAA